MSQGERDLKRKRWRVGKRGWVRQIGWREDFKNPRLVGCRMATDASIICLPLPLRDREGGRVWGQARRRTRNGVGSRLRRDQPRREEEINPPRNKPIGVRQGERDDRERGWCRPLLFTDAGFSALNVLSKMESFLGIVTKANASFVLPRYRD